jgi:hypothetical protein
MMTKAEFIGTLTAMLNQSVSQEVGLASPRPFLVKWNDEDFGQRSLVVIARTAADAREIAEHASGRYALSVQSL